MDYFFLYFVNFTESSLSGGFLAIFVVWYKAVDELAVTCHWSRVHPALAKFILNRRILGLCPLKAARFTNSLDRFLVCNKDHISLVQNLERNIRGTLMAKVEIFTMNKE